jgi:hypothetical protein
MFGHGADGLSVMRDDAYRFFMISIILPFGGALVSQL